MFLVLVNPGEVSLIKKHSHSHTLAWSGTVCNSSASYKPLTLVSEVFLDFSPHHRRPKLTIRGFDQIIYLYRVRRDCARCCVTHNLSAIPISCMEFKITKDKIAQ